MTQPEHFTDHPYFLDKRLSFDSALSWDLRIINQRKDFKFLTFKTQRKNKKSMSE